MSSTGGGGVTRMGRTEWLLLAALSVLWGGSFFFAKVAVREVPPLTLVLARVSIAAVALHLAVLASGRGMPRSAAAWRSFLVMGLLNNLVPFSLIFWGQTRIASGLASILNASTPLFTLVVAHLATRDEKLTGRRLAGVAVGMAGVAIVVGPDVLRGLSGGAAGQIAVLGAALSYACAGAFGRRFARMGIPPLATACGQVTGTTVLMLPLALAVDRPWTWASAPSATVAAAILALGLASTALAYVLFFRILAAAGAGCVMLVTFLVPVSAILLGALVLGERLAPRHLAGMAVIGLALATIDGRPLAALRARLTARAAAAPGA